MKATPHLSSPYGLLRSPWNFNPSPFVSRYGNVFRINDSSVIVERDVVFKYHMGVTCNDYTGFFSQVNGQPLETYLNKMEDDTHGIFHFTFGGVGGDQAVNAVEVLMSQFNFTYSNVAALAISAQPFFKKHLAIAKKTPVNCTTHPWQNEFLTTASGPGEYGGPTCDFAASYYDTEESLDELISYFFKIDPDRTDTVVNHILTLEYSDKAVLMKVVANMFPFDGDLAGSGAGISFHNIAISEFRSFRNSILLIIAFSCMFNNLSFPF